MSTKCTCIAILFSAITSLLSLQGCGNNSSPQNETIRGLQEENRVLKNESTGLEKKLASLRQEMQKLEGEQEHNTETFKKEYDEIQARERELHRAESAKYEKEIANLRLQLGSTQREKIALQEILDSKPRIADAKKERTGLDTLVLLLLLGILLMVLTYVAYRYRTVSDRLNLLTMHQIGQMRHLRSLP